MGPKNRCGRCRKLFRVTESYSKCVACILANPRVLNDRFNQLVAASLGDLAEYMERWYGEAPVDSVGSA